MKKINSDTLTQDMDISAASDLNTEIGSAYFIKNRLNKIETASAMLGRSLYILLSELTNGAASALYLKRNSEHPQTLANTLFRFGLGVSGKKLAHRFDFKTRYCKERQLVLLNKILEENKDTEFGIKHDFKNIKSVEDFQRKVPINTYDSLEEYVTRHTQGETNVLVKDKLVTYATTSGTTGTPKFIPITERAQKESHQNVSRTYAYTLYRENPEAFDGTILTIVSPAEEGRTPDGTIYGSTSGQLINNLSKVIQAKYTIPYDVLSLKSYEARNYCIILLGILNPVTMLSTANPSTLTLLAKQGNEWKGDLIKDVAEGTLKADLDIPDSVREQVEARITARKDLAGELLYAVMQDPENILRPRHYWSKLKLITCWTGGNSNVFLREMDKWYGNVSIRDLGYLASEIRGSIPMKNEDTAGVLTVGENFFEFIKVKDIDEVSPRYYMAHELEVGERYYVIFTTKAGLYRYNINDIIEVRGFENNTPKVIFVQKGKGVTNITGEKLYEQQLLTAVQFAEQETGLHAKFFMCYANVDNAQYELNVEFEQKPENEAAIQGFLRTVESKLCIDSLEYSAKLDSMRLNPMKLNLLADNSLEAFKAWRVAAGIREAQFKTTPLTDDIGLFEPLTVVKTFEAEKH